MDKIRLALSRELRMARARNPSYSLRQFSKKLGIGKTTISDFLASKRELSSESTGKVLSFLGINHISDSDAFDELGVTRYSLLESCYSITSAKNPSPLNWSFL